jgi:Collagen triple helix repeat (20 copies)
MFSTLRNRFGIPGVISVIALVFAMFGGAYAASNSSGGGKATVSAKAKKGPRGPKGATGPAGPAGPQGLAGASGAKGDNGAPGANGTNGAPGSAGSPGQSVTTASEPPFGGCGEEEGVKLTSASGTSYVCNGAPGQDGQNGQTGFTETLPPGKTETGSWILSDESPVVSVGTGLNFTSISFPIPLASAIPSNHAFYIGQTETVPAECNNPVHAGAPGPKNPEATSGNLCVFTNGTVFSPDGPEIVEVANEEFEPAAANTYGAYLYKPTSVEGAFWGSFAVTG